MILDLVRTTALFVLATACGVDVAEDRSEVTVASIASVSLVQASNAHVIGPIAEGQVIYLSSLPSSSISVEAVPNTAVGSVKLVLDGTYSHGENNAPYSLCGDTTGAFTACPQLSTIGAHTLVVTPYSAANQGGTAGTPLTLAFRVAQTPPLGSVASLTLVDAATGAAIAGYAPIVDGAVIDLANGLSIRANTMPTTVGSVAFELDGTYTHDENAAPYSLCGDAGTTYTACAQLARTGTHTLAATSYTGANLTGTASPAYQISFSVVSSGTPAPTLTLSAAASSVISGGTTTLTWSATNATACTASNAWTGNVGTAGTRVTSALTVSSTFTLTCTGAGGSVAKSVTVAVTSSSGGNSTGGCGPNNNLWVYHAGTFYWPGDFDGGGASANYGDTSGAPVYGPTDIKITMNASFGLWLPYSVSFDESIAGCNYLTLHLKYTVSDPAWTMWTILVGDHPAAGPGATLATYYQPTAALPHPTVNTWGYYKVPLTALYCPAGVTNLQDPRCTSSSVIYKFGLQDHTNTDPWFVEEVVFTAQ